MFSIISLIIFTVLDCYYFFADFCCFVVFYIFSVNTDDNFPRDSCLCVADVVMLMVVVVVSYHRLVVLM